MKEACVAKVLSNLPKIIVLVVLGAGLARLGWAVLAPSEPVARDQGFRLPRLTAEATAGQAAFDANCAKCHGANGTGGTGKGPPLIHPIYNPGHHGDESFFRAARYGVRAHHWKFGDMPAQPQVSDAELAEIVAYVREVQVANGIVYQEHRM
jgi:mono/diheme cytochrome c family protein